MCLKAMDSVSLSEKQNPNLVDVIVPVAVFVGYSSVYDATLSAYWMSSASIVVDVS